MNNYGYVIGTDFDNTIASYDNLMHNIATEKGLIEPHIEKSKKHIRDRIRKLPEGEIQWQKLQAAVYGTRMKEAILIDGVKDFFELCRRYRVKIFIISHKTEFARLDETRTNLRVAALAWMEMKGFFEVDGPGLGLTGEDVYFEPTRREKIDRIKRLGCTHYIDDLEETFCHDAFPKGVCKILYAPYAKHSNVLGVRAFGLWKEIGNYLFNARS